MKKSLIATALIVSTLAARAQDTSWYQNANFGAGKRNCSKWSKEKFNSSQRDEDVAWVLGYLSADATRTPSGKPAVKPEEIPAEVDAICAAQPDSDLRTVTRLLAVRHGLEPMPN